MMVRPARANRALGSVEEKVVVVAFVMASALDSYNHHRHLMVVIIS
jgi:hypothetical protein